MRMSLWRRIIVLLLLIYLGLLTVVLGGPVSIVRRDSSDIVLGRCVWVRDRQCPDNDVKFYLFTRKNPNDRQTILAAETWEKSNLSVSHFDPMLPTKVVMHGYNSDMYLSSLIDMKDEYLQRGEYNLFYIDYSDLAQGPCYVQAVHNLRHVGKCLGLLLDRILETGTNDIHLIGFSLGAQLANFAAKAIRPYVLPRITGLDPAMPLFVGVGKDDKLDSSDAKFVDVYHTNAFVQGKVEQCGVVDFYFNGGILQPGCTTWKDNPVGCSHNRAPMYFMESINTQIGFYAWPCTSYMMYVLRFCQPSKNTLFLAGEDIRESTKGMMFLNTNSITPFAKGRDWNKKNRYQIQSNDYMTHSKRRDPLIEEIDQWGKLDGAFNNVDHFPTPFPQDPNDGWDYFGHEGPHEITNQNDFVFERGEDVGEQDDTGPFGVQVEDLLHRNRPTESHKYHRKRKPNHKFRVVSRPSNSTGEEMHLIEKLWRDYNDDEYRPTTPRWRKRNKYRGDRDEDEFHSQPWLRQRSEDWEEVEVATERPVSTRIIVLKSTKRPRSSD